MKRFRWLAVMLTVLGTRGMTQPERPMHGKTAIFIGDSITRGAQSYVETVRQTLGLTAVINAGIGGGALCRRNTIPRFQERLFREKRIDDAYPPVVDRWRNLEPDADIVFLLIGTNDYNSRVPLGPPDSTDPHEFNGGLNVVLRGLKEKYPDRLIVISTILRRRGGGNLGPYNQAIKAAAKRHGIPCFNAHDNSGLDFEQEFRAGVLQTTRDGLHPNEKGSAILGRHIALFLHELIRATDDSNEGSRHHGQGIQRH